MKLLRNIKVLVNKACQKFYVSLSHNLYIFILLSVKKVKSDINP